ncbi:MAG: hypothetical protein ACM3H7_07730, partial [Acidobacteriaceae bacterium]
MRVKISALIMAVSMLLAACKGPNSSAASPSPQAISSTHPSAMTSAYPEPDVITPLPDMGSYPAPSTPMPASNLTPLSGYEAQPGDESLTRQQVFLDLANSFLAITTTQPSQVNAILKGDLPDACHQLRVGVAESGQASRISLDVYSLTDSSVKCTAMLQPFTASIPLGTYPADRYTVTANGQKLAEVSMDFAPQPGDEQLIHDEVVLDISNSQLITSAAQPIQASIVLKGSLPDACHQLRVTVTQPDENDVINLEAYSVARPDAICTANLRPFEAPVLLGSYSSGHFIIYINGQMLGEFGIGYAPQPGDTSLARGEVFIDLENSQLLTSLARPIDVK